MLNLIGTLAATAATLLPSAAVKPQTKPAPPPSGTIIVKMLPDSAVKNDGNYAVDPGFSQDAASADSRYNEMKQVLDERFAYMFDLKKNLDTTQADTAAKWDEYYAMRQAYEKQLKKIIADWVTDQQYQAK